MLKPAPTTPIDPRLARGRVLEHRPATATEPELIVLGFPNTSYRTHLIPVGRPAPAVGEAAIGTVRADARRVDVVRSGGRYVEPVLGRPRRVQGSVVATDPAANTITVNAGIAIVCTLTALDRSGNPQRAEQFRPGEFVSFDVLRGATFEPAPA